jgi:hypothetical protein
MKNFQVKWGLILLTIAVLGSFGFMVPIHGSSPAADSTTGFAIVELFTSEGCSSCPAADVLAASISAENNRNIHFLAFHVDYWNQYGWKDIFSSNNYTARQEQYAGFFKLKSIYTPQVVVNGKTEFVGSNESKLRSAIQNELKTPPAASINLETTSDTRTVTVKCALGNAVNSVLNVALVQKQAEVQVKRGENAGKILRHIDIVRGFKKVAVLTDNPDAVILYIPEGLSAKDLKVVAYLQNRDDYKITGVAVKTL